MSKYNHFEVITVNSSTFSLNQSVAFGFISAGFSLLNRGTRIIEYSFDGVTVHGDLNPADSSNYLVFENRTESRIWFRVQTGIATDVRVEAWGGWGRKL